VQKKSKKEGKRYVEFGVKATNRMRDDIKSLDETLTVADDHDDGKEEQTGRKSKGRQGKKVRREA
jgi:hypothetical protein